MQVKNSLIAGALVSSSLLVTMLSATSVVAQSSRPYVVFVNGWQNCCSWGMNALQDQLINQMNAETRYVPYSNFDNNGSSGNTSTDERFLRDGADFINNQLDKNRPLILIGHSFGGDSVLKLLPRINRRIQFVAVIDPVRTGGFRASLKSLNVPSNVDYFYNRWQTNEPFPNDFKVNGSIPCNATKKCDQASQFALTNTDGKARTQKCGLLETCRTKQVRAGHQSLPTDDYIQKIIGDEIQKQIAQLASTSTPSTAYFNYGGAVHWYRRSAGGYCGITSPTHLKVLQITDPAPSLGDRSPSEFGRNLGVCPPYAFYFNYGGGVLHFSSNRGGYCAFTSPGHLQRFQQSNPAISLENQTPGKDFGRDLGVCP